MGQPLTEYTEQERARFKAEFAKRKIYQFRLLGVLFAVGVICVLPTLIVYALSHNQTLTTLLMLPAVIILFGYGAYAYNKWRCPACNRSLGREIEITYCPHCGVQLR